MNWNLPLSNVIFYVVSDFIFQLPSAPRGATASKEDDDLKDIEAQLQKLRS
jgi:hypothetical protein